MATGRLRIGTGGTPIVEAIPAVDAPANLTGQDEEDMILSTPIGAAVATAITTETTAAVGAAPLNMLVQIEFEEYPAA